MKTIANIKRFLYLKQEKYRMMAGCGFGKLVESLRILTGFASPKEEERLTINQVADVYIENRFYQFFNSDDVVTTLVAYMLKSMDASKILEQALTIEHTFYYQEGYTSSDDTHHYVNTTKFKLSMLREMLRLGDPNENNRLIDIAFEANMKAQSCEKELRMVLDDGQPGMVVRRLQSYRYDCVGIDYYSILYLAIERGNPTYDDSGLVKNAEMCKLLVSNEFDLPTFDTWYVEVVC
jgi:hypothetical protein